MKRQSTQLLKKYGFNINFSLEHETFDFIGYEIEANEPIVMYGEEEYLFRVDIDKNSGTPSVYMAFFDDYDIGEDFTDFFNTTWLLEKIKEVVKNNDVHNSAQYYIEHYKDKEIVI